MATAGAKTKPRAKPVEKKVYMPRYYGWLMTAVLGIIWLILTYSTFYTERGKELGLIGWAGFSAMFLLLLIFMWLLALQKLPAYIIKE